MTESRNLILRWQESSVGEDARWHDEKRTDIFGVPLLLHGQGNNHVQGCGVVEPHGLTAVVPLVCSTEPRRSGSSLPTPPEQPSQAAKAGRRGFGE